MNINSDINVLGSLPDWNLINVFLNQRYSNDNQGDNFQNYTKIKTDKSVKRFESAITNTLISFKSTEISSIIGSAIESENISKDTLIILFWNASYNNTLLNYLNEHVFFPAFFSGRITVKADEVLACLRELKEKEDDLKKWSESTLMITASKYLTLLKKFGLMEGSTTKTIFHPYLSDKLFVLFLYWLVAIEQKPNILESKWLNYGFFEKQVFIDRVLQKKLFKYINLTYSGDKLHIEPLFSYENIYHEITKS